MTIYAYIRKDYPESLEEQIKKINDFKYDKLIIEDNALDNHQELEKLLASLLERDYLIISDMRVFSYSLKALKKIYVKLQEKEVTLVSINEHIDTSKSPNFFHDMIRILESDEKHRKYLVNINITRARNDGRIGGRPTISSDTIEKIQYLYIHEKLTLREIAEKCDISLGTAYKYAKRDDDGNID